MEDVTPSKESMEDAAIAQRLRRTWTPFFSRFGRLTSVQRAGIPAVLDGADVLISSATASGKTEAACAPLVERHFHPRNPWTILYICPTRALVNDLYFRLERPLRELRARVARRTGDHGGLPANQNVIITTPESFDSLLCRGRFGDGAHCLSDVVAIVLDEIHLLAGSARGEMVRWTMERLRRFASQLKEEGRRSVPDIQIVALSATLRDPDETLNDFLQCGRLIEVPASRPIEDTRANVGADVVVTLCEYVEGIQQKEKILVFCNSRKRVDTLAERLASPLEARGYLVCAHHGSLSQKIREGTESLFKANSGVVCVSTSTLELGVDIGDIDLVVLDGPPPDTSSLMQRIGRGNRRTNVTRLLSVPRDAIDEVIFDVMVGNARKGDLSPYVRGPQYAVALQQVASYIFQSPAMRTRSRVQIRDLVRTCGRGRIDEVLVDHMIQTGQLIAEGNRVGLGEEWTEKTERGQIHSVIEAPQGMSVVDRQSGMPIATGISVADESALTIGGRVYEVRSVSGRVVEVSGARTGKSGSETKYRTGRSLMSGMHSELYRMHLDLDRRVWPAVIKNGDVYAFHLGGVIRRIVLDLVMAGRGEAFPVNNWYVQLPISFDDCVAGWKSISESELKDQVSGNLDSVERRLARPYANRDLPRDLRVEEAFLWLSPDTEISVIRAASIEVASSGPIFEALSKVLEAGDSRR